MPIGFGSIWSAVLARVGAVQPSYDVTLSVQADNGFELIGGSWDTSQADHYAYDTDVNGAYRDTNDFVTGLSFPGAPAASCSLATLTFFATAILGSPRVFGHEPAGHASLQWSASFLPSDHFSDAVASSVAVSGASGLKTVDVTTMVQQIMAGGFYTPGGRINFWIEADSVGAWTLIRGTLGSTPHPRLVIYA